MPRFLEAAVDESRRLSRLDFREPPTTTQKAPAVGQRSRTVRDARSSGDVLVRKLPSERTRADLNTYLYQPPLTSARAAASACDRSQCCLGAERSAAQQKLLPTCGLLYRGLQSQPLSTTTHRRQIRAALYGASQDTWHRTCHQRCDSALVNVVRRVTVRPPLTSLKFALSTPFSP